MIYDLLAHASAYHDVHPLLAAAFRFARQVPRNAPPGRTDIDGDKLYAMMVGYRTSAAAERPFEAHRRYIDLQIVLDGAERLDVTFPGKHLAVTDPYDDEKDAELYAPTDDCSSLILRAGSFALLFPHDVHRPGCTLAADADVTKLVVKLCV